MSHNEGHDGHQETQSDQEGKIYIGDNQADDDHGHDDEDCDNDNKSHDDELEHPDDNQNDKRHEVVTIKPYWRA